MVSVLKGEILKSKVDACANCGKRLVANSVMCAKCGKWVHCICVKMKRVTSTLAKDFVCELCVYTKEGILEPGEKIFFDQVAFVKGFCYLGNRLIASGGSEAAVTARTKIGWKNLENVGSYFMETVFIKIKGRIYHSCMRLVIMYGKEMWCLRGNEMAILRTKKAIMRAMCGVKTIEKRKSQEVMSLLGLKDIFDGLARVRGV